MYDVLNNLAKGAIIGLVTATIVIVIYDVMVDETISININEWQCTKFKTEEHILTNKTVTFNRCVQWTKDH